MYSRDFVSFSCSEISQLHSCVPEICFKIDSQFREIVTRVMYVNWASTTVTSTYRLYVYRVSQEEWPKLRESVPYVKIYRYSPKHLYPKLNGYGDNGQRSLKV